MLTYSALRSLLFRLDAERSHELARFALQYTQRIPSALARLRGHFAVDDPGLVQRIWGVDFPNPVGLAAGLDKNAELVAGLAALGFGFIETGSITPQPQAGNPRPRLFRFAEAKSIQNAMGFNNAGMEVTGERLARTYPAPVPLGINIGKNKATPAERALDDYRALTIRLQPYCDYLVVNVSSPNTPGLRDLQNETFVTELFTLLRGLTPKPVLLKIAPDMPVEAAVSLCQTAVENGAAGIIASNTTVDYSLLPGAHGVGGISGQALREKSFAFFDGLAKHLFRRTVLISAGGIDSGREAYRRIQAGASLIQIYTALVFEGPGLIQRINRELLALLERDGFRTVNEAVGSRR